MKVAIIVAIAEGNAIGKDQQLLCHMPADLKRFKALTTGHTIIMGRKTFESLPHALQNRRNIDWMLHNGKKPSERSIRRMKKTPIHIPILIIVGKGILNGSFTLFCAHIVSMRISKCVAQLKREQL